SCDRRRAARASSGGRKRPRRRARGGVACPAAARRPSAPRRRAVRRRVSLEILKKKLRRRSMPHRFATLAVALAAAAPALAQELFPDFSGEATVDAETFQSVGDLEFSARGRVEMKRDESSIYAERLRFNRETGRLEASGGVRLSSGADRFYGPR